MAERTPVAEQPLVDDGAGSTSWEVARERLENPEKPRTYWIATVRPDGRPHLMPIIGSWIDGALYFLSGDTTRKGRNLAGDARCVIATGSLKLPSLDIVVEGKAERITDETALRRVTDVFRTKMEWPLEVRGEGVHGPNAPTAGPPPYTVFRLTPSTVFGLPGMTGMEQFDPADLPRPTRWRFKHRGSSGGHATGASLRPELRGCGGAGGKRAASRPGGRAGRLRARGLLHRLLRRLVAVGELHVVRIGL